MRTLKISVIGTFVFALSSTPGMADRGVRLGGKFGANLSSFANNTRNQDDPLFEVAHKGGLSGGLYMDVPVYLGRVHVAIHPELLATSRGGAFRYGGMEIGSYELRYVDICLLTGAYAALGYSWSPYFLAGPRSSWRFSAFRITADGTRTDFDHMFKSFDLGVVIGMGAAWTPPFPGQLLFEVRYDRGFMTVEDMGSQSDERTNYSLSFMIGYSPDLFPRRPRASRTLPIEPVEDIEPAEPADVDSFELEPAEAQGAGEANAGEH